MAEHSPSGGAYSPFCQATGGLVDVDSLDQLPPAACVAFLSPLFLHPQKNFHPLARGVTLSGVFAILRLVTHEPSRANFLLSKPFQI